MSDFKQPTCGRLVHFFPAQMDSTITAEKCPAIVLNDDTYPDLCVFWEGGGGVRKSVPHKSKAAAPSSYWDWPEIK